MSSVGDELGVYDETLLSQTMDGVTAKDIIISDAREAMRTYATVEAVFEREGLKLTDDLISYADTTLSSFWNSYGSEMKSYGIAKSSIRLVLENALKSEMLLKHLYGEGGELEIPNEELSAYYEENYRRTILLVMSMANLSEESFATKERLFDEYFERANNGEELFDLIVEEYARTGGMTLEATYEFFEGNTQEQIISRDVDFPAGLVEQIFETSDLDTPKQYSDDNYNIIFEVRELWGDGYNFKYLHDSLLSSCAADDYSAFLAKQSNEIDYVENSDAISLYLPERILKS